MLNGGLSSGESNNNNESSLNEQSHAEPWAGISSEDVQDDENVQVAIIDEDVEDTIIDGNVLVETKLAKKGSEYIY
jgi:hypothetical protein